MRTRRKSLDQRRREAKLRKRQVLANESPEQKEIRLDHLRRYRRRVRDSETPEEREARLALDREARRRTVAKKRQEKAALQQQQQQQPQNKTKDIRQNRGRGGQRTWEALEEAAGRLLGDRWKLLETLMSERKSGISVEEASDMFPREIRQGLIHMCCLCQGLLFQKSEAKTARVKEEETSAEEAPCPHTDTVQLCVV